MSTGVDIRRYVPLASTFTLLASALTHAAARRNRAPAGALELTESALATFFIARVVAHERVGSVVREPFVEPVPGADPADASGANHRPAGEGLRRSVGELITCTRCLGPWAASIVAFGQVFAPRHGRILTRVLALAGANTMLQAAHTAATNCANHLARER